jgi:erythronate-4-phosphate dehydrogenase
VKILADENIPFAREAFSPFGDVTLRGGRSMAAADLSDADVLLVRSVTRVDSALLEGTPVRFVGTATIGVDHIDTAYLKSAGIAFADAAGSNSRSVAEYVIAALLELRAHGVTLDGTDLGIIGVGRIGTLVMEMATTLGMRPVGYDPPRAERDGFRSASLEELVECPLLTIHVPLVRDGRHSTRHLVDDSFLEKLSDGAAIINTSRGGVIDSAALIRWLQGGRGGRAILDVWEGEPDIPSDLVEHCLVTTPHIAGYSLDGKLRGTAMLAEALGHHYGVESPWNPAEAIPADAGTIEITPNSSGLDAVAGAVRGAYDIRRDDAALRLLLGRDEAGRRAGFDDLRRSYPVRREFPAWRPDGITGSERSMLAGLGFRVE